MFVLGALYRRHGTMLFRHNQFKGSVLQTKNHFRKMDESSFNYSCSHDTVCKMYLQMPVTKTFIVAKKHVMSRVFVVNEFILSSAIVFFAA